MEHRLWKTLRGKRQEDKKRILPCLIPVKNLTKSGNLYDKQRAMDFQKHERNFNGLKTGHSVHESNSFSSPKLRIAQRKQEVRPLRRKNADIHVPTSLQVGGSTYSKVIQDETIGRRSISQRHKNETKPSDSSNSQSLLQQPRIPASLPHIPSVQTPRNRLKNERPQLATHLNIIDGRRRTHSFRKDSDDSYKERALGDKTVKSSFNQEFGSKSVLQTELSLPKITIDEVLKSWDIHTSVPIRKRSAGSKALKHDPMEFLIRQELENSINLSRQEASPCFDELKTCRYLRLDKDMEEKVSHESCCPCNSCEHGGGLKESPYLNA